jgi:hypothetical protein
MKTKTKRTLVGVFFTGTPGDQTDLLCETIFKAHKGVFENCGTFIATLERDVEYRIPQKHVSACVNALKAAGFNPVVGTKAVDKRFAMLLNAHFS